MHDERASNRFELNPDLAAVQRQLANFAPIAPQIQRDQLMFAAGRAAERAEQSRADGSSASQTVYVTKLAACSSFGATRLRYFWPAAAATMTAATVVLSVVLVWQQLPKPVAQQVATDRPAIKVEAVDTALAIGPPAYPLYFPSSADGGYLGARNAALTRGIGALANERTRVVEPAGDKKPVTARELLDELLPAARLRG